MPLRMPSVSNYIPHYTKKLCAQRRKEEALRRLIERRTDVVLLVTQAIEVRDARVRTLRARLATLSPGGVSDSKLYRALAERISAAEQVDPRAILLEFGVSPAQFGENDSSPSL